MGIVFTASVASRREQNAEISRIDLADLSKNGPRGKFPFSSRAGVNNRVRPYFPRFVGFSKIVPCFAPCFGDFGRLTKTRK